MRDPRAPAHAQPVARHVSWSARRGAPVAGARPAGPAAVRSSSLLNPSMHPRILCPLLLRLSRPSSTTCVTSGRHARHLGLPAHPRPHHRARAVPRARGAARRFPRTPQSRRRPYSRWTHHYPPRARVNVAACSHTSRHQRPRLATSPPLPPTLSCAVVYLVG